MNLDEATFETDRLLLEPLRKFHAAELIGILTDARMYLYTPQDPPSLDALTRRYAMLEGRRSPDGRERWLNWVLRSKADRVCIGTVQVTIDPKRRTLLAYEVGVPYWRQGFATEACRRIIEAIFAEGISTIRAELDTRNKASMRLLERLGFRRGPLRKDADFFKGSTSDEWTYVLTRAERREDK